MALTVKYHNAAFPEGQEMDLGGFLVENGGSVELTEENEASIMSRTGMMPEDYFGESEDAEVSGSGFLSQSDLEAMHPPPVEVEEETAPVETAPAKKTVVAAKKEEGGDTT